MTREDLAKDILLAYIRSQDRAVVEIPFADLAADAVDQADALLDALGVKEAPTSWLSKEMQKTGTPAGCLPVLREEWFPEDGSKVRVRNPQGLSPQSSRLYAGKVGRVTESHKDTGLCYVAFDTSWGRFWASELEHVA